MYKKNFYAFSNLRSTTTSTEIFTPLEWPENFWDKLKIVIISYYFTVIISLLHEIATIGILRRIAETYRFNEDFIIYRIINCKVFSCTILSSFVYFRFFMHSYQTNLKSVSVVNALNIEMYMKCLTFLHVWLGLENNHLKGLRSVAKRVVRFE